MSWVWPAAAARSSALLVGVGLALLGGTAHAAPCGRPDVDLTFPPDGATAVPSNAILAAHYGSPVRYADEVVSLLDDGGRNIGVTLAYDDADSMLRATPDQPLAAGHFDLVWPGLRGVSGSGGVGRGRSVGFTVTSTVDATPPVFAPRPVRITRSFRSRDDPFQGFMIVLTRFIRGRRVTGSRSQF